MIKVSVIVPVYNVEKYLEACLNSLVNQTLKDIEIIVVNDGSPDNSQTIIDKYVKKYPEKVKSIIKENGGLGSARNVALKIAKGKYIGFVDSDDSVELDMYENMYNKALKEKSDIVICDMVTTFPNSIVYRNCTNFTLPYEKTPSVCNKLFKKTCIQDLSFAENKKWYEDYNFTTKIYLKNPKISCINKGYYLCNAREGSIMLNNNSIKNLDIIDATEDIIKYAKKNKVYDDNIIKYLIFDHILITSVNRVAIQKSDDKRYVIKELVKYCHKYLKNYNKNEFYKMVSKNRRIIAWFNYHNLYYISRLILKTKAMLKGK